MHTVCDSEVVSPGRNDASMACDSPNRTLGALSAPPSRVPLRDHVAQARLRPRTPRNLVLVRGSHAAIVGVAVAAEREVEGEEEVGGR